MILVTGGLGFIGSHTVVELVNCSYDVIILDDLSNSNLNVLNNLFKIVDKKKIKFYKGSILDDEILTKIFKSYNIDCVIHFAAFKSVSESIKEPLRYYENNVSGTINLLQQCNKYNVKNFIFSSSATVYGNSKSPLLETSQTGEGITNPYGQSKYIIENILKDFSKSSQTKIICLRYFNPVGAHSSGLIGEDPMGIPNNLMPYLLRVVIKNNLNDKLNDVYKKLNIFGNDYKTKDGTGVRDFIHVVDLAKAHVCACINLSKLSNLYNIYNIGTGKGTSVLELVNTFIDINNVKLPYCFKKRREGDIDIVYCVCDKAKNELNWEASLNIENICSDSYNYIVTQNK